MSTAALMAAAIGSVSRRSPAGGPMSKPMHETAPARLRRAPSTPTGTSSSRPTCGRPTSSREYRDRALRIVRRRQRARGAGDRRRALEDEPARLPVDARRDGRPRPARDAARPRAHLPARGAVRVDGPRRAAARCSTPRASTRSILYTTVGLLWEAELEDPELCQAYTRAYNRWICEFCAGSARLVPTAHLSLGDPGGRGRASSSGPSAKAPRAPTSPRSPTTADRSATRTTTRCSPPRRTSTCPFAIHPTFEPQWTKGTRMGAWENVQAAAPAGVGDRVRRRAPPVHDAVRLRRVRQVPAAEGARARVRRRLDRLLARPHRRRVRPHVHRHAGAARSTSRATTSASGSGSRCDPDERTIPTLAERFGVDRFLWASDFPHADHTPEYVDDLEELAAGFTDDADRQAFLGGNARRLFDIPDAAIAVGSSAPGPAAAHHRREG